MSHPQDREREKPEAVPGMPLDDEPCRESEQCDGRQSLDDVPEPDHGFFVFR